MQWIGEFGSAKAALMARAGKQIRYQKRAQEAERQAADLRKLVPPTGAVILTGDEAKAYQELKAKGTTLDKVPALLTKASELSASSEKKARADALTLAAGKKYKLAVLTRLLGDTPVEFKTTMVRDGETVTEEQVPYVKVNDTLELLDTYAAREFKDWMDILAADPNAVETPAPSSGSSAGSTTTMVRQTGAPSTTTTKGTPAAKGNLAAVNKVLDAKYMTPSQRRAAAAGKP